ncbi:MAG: IPTL-CTERM sorting domain-containing protein [candidate division Zixibacteria bacterium]
MVKLITISLAINLVVSGYVLAQDQGQQDSIIVQDVFISDAVEFIHVPIYVVTDDPAAFYNLPLRFTFTEEGIVFSSVEYYTPEYDWDEDFNEFIVIDEFLRVFGVYDLGDEDNQPLNTDYERVQYWTVIFSVEPGAANQVGVIDTVNDHINGSIQLGLTDGLTEFTPAFVPGQIVYIPEEIPTLSQWAMVILTLSLLATGTVAIIRRRKKVITV